MTNYPLAPGVISPETYQIAAVNTEDYWRYHAAGIRAIAYVLGGEAQQVEEPSTHDFVMYSLNEQAEKSDLRGDKERLIYLSNTDPLTGIHNRRGAEQSYEALASTGHGPEERRRIPKQPIDAQILLVDVDNFKQVNDKYGHGAGDDVLAKVAKAMTANTRSNDILARWGGDEFVILLPRAPKNRAEQVAQAIRKAVQDTTYTTVSVGIGAIDYAKSLEQIIEDADKALSTAKTASKNTVVHFDDLQA